VGSIENRSRIIFEVYEEIRRRVGKGYPVLIKINCEDFYDGGLTFEDSLYVCKELSAKEIDAIEVSGGTKAAKNLSYDRPHITSPEKEAYFQTYAAKVAEKVNAPVILVGGLRSLKTMERLLNVCCKIKIPKVAS
jgi:2,4-dienoyl-CoA reductase-like NADH-dependent reductase (Old Yellow Enzyme family)